MITPRAYLKEHINFLKQNIVSGIRVAFFNKSAISRFQVGMDEAVILLLFNLLVDVVIGYLLYMPDPQYNRYGIAGFAMVQFGLILTAFILAKFARDTRSGLQLVIIVLSTQPVFATASLLTHWMTHYFYIYYAILAWMIATVFFIVFQLLNRRIWSSVITVCGYLILVISPSMFILGNNFWYKSYKHDAYYDKYDGLNQENIFYKQFDYLDSLKHTLLPGRPSVTDLYFLGFGSYAKENVFKKEILYIQNLMDDEFDTSGRSIALINNHDTMDTIPLATMSNLSRALKDIGQAMNRDQDVLLVYLTSHGSSKPRLSVNFWPLELNQISPEDLKQALDEAGIKWRVILISACYSGGFIDTLKNENSIVMTAAARDRTSFGCGSKSNFTYFGQAVFKDELARNFSFIPSFEKARGLIAEREKREKITPSHPQLYVGKNIRPVLSRLETELNRYYHR